MKINNNEENPQVRAHLPLSGPEVQHLAAHKPLHGTLALEVEAQQLAQRHSGGFHLWLLLRRFHFYWHVWCGG